VDKYGLHCWYTNTTAESPPFPLSSVYYLTHMSFSLYRKLNLLFHIYRFSLYKNLLSKIHSDEKMIVLCNSMIWIISTALQLVLWIHSTNDLPSPVPPPNLLPHYLFASKLSSGTRKNANKDDGRGLILSHWNGCHRMMQYQIYHYTWLGKHYSNSEDY